MSVINLKQAESSHKPDMLALIEELRNGIESGEIIELVAIPVCADRVYHVRSAGAISMLELSGLLGSAWLSAAVELREGKTE